MNFPIDDPNASSRECILQHGKGENHIRALREAERSVQEEVKLLKLILIRQLFKMRMKETKEETTHINTFNSVLT